MGGAGSTSKRDTGQSLYAFDANAPLHSMVYYLTHQLSDSLSDNEAMILLTLAADEETSVFNKILHKLKHHNITLTEHDIETIGKTIVLQRKLSEDIQASVEARLRIDENNLIFFNTIEQSEYESLDIIRISQVNMMTKHLMDTLSNELQLFKTNDEFDKFMSKLIHVLPLFHPCINKNTHEDGVRNLFKTVNENMNINHNSSINTFIELIIHRLLIMGPTYKRGATHTIHLLDIYFMFEEIIKAHLPSLYDHQNLSLIQMLDAVSITFESIITDPTAYYAPIISQAHDQHYNIFGRIEQFASNNTKNIIRSFFSGTRFKCFYGEGEALKSINHQAFFTALAHRTHEAIIKSKNQQIIDLLSICKRQLITNEFSEHGLRMQIKQSKLETILPKIICDYIHSYRPTSLILTALQLMRCNLKRSSHVPFQPLINPDIPAIEKHNLSQFCELMTSPSHADRLELTITIMLNIILSIGMLNEFNPLPVRPLSRTQSAPALLQTPVQITFNFFSPELIAANEQNHTVNEQDHAANEPVTVTATLPPSMVR